MVYEYLQRNPVSPEYKYVWEFIEPEKYPDAPNKLTIDTPRFYITVLRAGNVDFKALADKLRQAFEALLPEKCAFEK